MINVTTEYLKTMEMKLYRCGMVAGISITSVKMEDGRDAKKEVFSMYHNRKITVRIYSLRNEHGVWCIPCRIQFEDEATQLVTTYNTKEGL